MKQYGLVLSFAAICALSAPAFAAEPHHWDYENPAGWGELSDEFKECSVGEEQSPVDIVSASAVPAEFKPAEVHWQAFAPTVVNNGHTIQVNTGGKGGYVELNGVRYDLVQFHFHHESEHTVDGKHAPMEVHFVNKSAAGDLLVLGVMVEPGAANPTIDTVWANLPEAGKETPVATTIDPSTILPADHGSFRYAGSLTTPPCSQIVTWNVYTHPTELSAGQIDAFAALYPNDARPVQPLNRRFVLNDDATQ